MLLLLLACSGPTEVNAVDFDQTCEVVEDCVAVQEGNQCGCPCGGAIRADALPSWEEAVREASGRCTGPIPPCDPCPESEIACEAGTCASTYLEAP